MPVTRTRSPEAQKFLNQLNGLKNPTAKVGVVKSLQYPNGIEVAYVAAIQELGYEKYGIAPRGFFRTTQIEHYNEWRDQMAKGLQQFSHGKLSLGVLLERVSSRIAGQVRKAITENTSPALSPVTLLLRKWKKEGNKYGRPISITRRTVAWAAAEFSRCRRSWLAHSARFVDPALQCLPCGGRSAPSARDAARGWR